MKFTEFIGITTRNMHVKFEAVRRSYNFWRKNAYSAGPSKQDENLTFTQCSPKFMKLTEVIGITTRNMHVKFEAAQRSYNFWPKNAYSARPSKQDEILTFSQCSSKFMKLTEFIEITSRNMHVKFEAVWRSYNFWQKNAYSAGPSKQDEILTFSQCSPKFMKLTEVIGITTRNMHVKFEAVWRSYNFWGKNAYSAGPSKQDEILTFSQCSQKFMKLTEFIVITTRNMHVKFEAARRSYNFWRKMPSAPDLKNRMKFRHFLNVLKNSWNLQNSLESTPETCMWNLRQFGEVTIFDRKMPTAPTLQNRMKFWHSLNFLQNSWNLQKLLESPPETCMWNLRQFGEVTIFDGKMPTAPDLQNRMKIRHFLNVLKNSWISQNLLESPPETCMWNLRPVWRSYNFWRKNAYSHGPSKQDEILTFSQCSQKFMKFTEFIGITTRNMHVKFEAVRRSYNFWRKNAYSARPSKRDEN